MIQDMRHNISFEDIAKKHNVDFERVIQVIGAAWDEWQIERNLTNSAYGIGIREMVERNMFSKSFIAEMFSVKITILEKVLKKHNIKRLG